MKYWTTNTGEELLIKDMETSHIENCIRFIEKKIKNGDTTKLIGGGNTDDTDGMWAEEIDITEELEEYVDTFKKELKGRLNEPN